jgi:protein-S-isoprenylcysteine O-methyltransferase Ste14
MELFPALRLGWLNGWLFLAALSLTDAITFRLFPKAVVERLFDRSGWSREQVAFTVIGKLIALISLVLIALTPLKLGQPVLVIGVGSSALGLAGLVWALISFRDTPVDQPVTIGLYRISRHPQIVMSFVVLAGACLAVGSWTALAIQIVSHLFTHLGILGEEDVCIRRYGDSYRAYLRRVPRYFVFF